MSGAQAIFDQLDVSRETFDRLKIYATLLEKWNPKINLVSKSSLADLWIRHILDSAQLFDAAPDDGHWVDLGSGGGFPGLVIGCLAAERAPDMQITLIESDQRKSAFLRTVVREVGIRVNVIADRIENAEPQGADILSARALADLTKLLEFSERHQKPDGIALFPKGVRWEKEVTDALTRWSFEHEPIRSKTEPGAVILKIKGAVRV